MTHRILHCGKSIENYYICVEERIAGFSNRAPTLGDTVYLVVKVGNSSLCGARGKLGDVTKTRPWKDAINYPNVRALEQLEFCEPFDVIVLKSVGGNSWHLKYFQSAKAIKEPEAVQLLEKAFNANRRETFTKFKDT
jgi:hypothetical protein